MTENEMHWPEQGERARLIPGEVGAGRRVGLTPTIVVVDEAVEIIRDAQARQRDASPAERRRLRRTQRTIERLLRQAPQRSRP